MSAPYKLHPFFKYAGGKWRTVDRYPKPLMRTIVEPFAGSAGYSTAYADRQVILIDKDERICGAWDWLIKASSTDVLSLPLLEHGEKVDDLIIPQEAKWFIGYNINIGAGPRRTATRWSKDHLWTEAKRLSVARQVPRIKHWRIVHGSYDAVNVRATYFIDPPYQRKSFYRERVDDYAVLRTWIEALHGQIIVCEGEGADWLPFRHLFDVKTHVNAEQDKVGELLWYKMQ